MLWEFHLWGDFAPVRTFPSTFHRVQRCHRFAEAAPCSARVTGCEFLKQAPSYIGLGNSQRGCHLPVFRSGSECLHWEHRNIPAIFHNFKKSKTISLPENKHVCCLNAKEGNSFWTCLPMNEHLSNGNETWCYYVLIASAWSPKRAFIT